jgi:hypothetical protein
LRTAGAAVVIVVIERSPSDQAILKQMAKA